MFKYRNPFAPKIILLVLSFFVLTILSEIHEIVPEVSPDAISPADSVFDKPLSQILDLSFYDKFDESIVILDSLVKRHPNHPAPYFFKAAIYQNWMSVYRFNKFQKELEENVQLAIDIGNSLLENSDDPWLHFYIGGAYGYRGFNRFRKFNWIGAYLDGQKGIENFKEALEKDNTLYDVYLGLGSYYYWRTAKSKFLKFIAFWMSDKRELGLKQLYFVMKHGRYAKNEAGYALIASLFDSKEYKQAYEITQNLIDLKSSPNLIDIYYKARLLLYLEKWQESTDFFQQILNIIENYKYPSIGFQVECKYWIALSWSKLGKNMQAFQMTTNALQLSRKRNSDQEMEGYIEKYNDILKELENLHYDLIKKINKKN